MKLSRLVLVAIGATTFLLQTTQATLLFSDGFNYSSPGNLGGNINTGSGYKWGPGNANLTIANANLTYTGLQDLGGKDLSVGWGVSAGTATNGFANITRQHLLLLPDRLHDTSHQQPISYVFESGNPCPKRQRRRTSS